MTRTLGISGRHRDAAAALAVDGRIVAAASEDSFTRVPGIGYTHTGGFPAAAVRSCLERAGLVLEDLDHVTVVEAEGGEADAASAAGWAEHLPAATVDALHADAMQAAVSGDTPEAVFVVSTRPAAMAAFVVRDGHVRANGRVAGGDGLVAAARVLARALGVDDADPVRGLDRLSVGAEAEFRDELGHGLAWSSNGRGPMLAVDLDRLTSAVGRAAGPLTSSLADAGSMNVRVETMRRALAASFASCAAAVVRDAAETFREAHRARSLAFGGGMFAHPRFNTELRQLVGDEPALAVVPEPAGRALGAALAARAAAPGRLSGLALGPAFSDADIKRVLDNCRLDYVYEPDWPRLLQRISKMLAQGKVVAWFQGAMAFGPRTMGTRSVLCDPSSRYARQNVNEYLRQVPLDEPLPVVFAPSTAGRCLVAPTSSPLAGLDAVVCEDWRKALAAAIDARGRVRVEGVRDWQAPELGDLLEAHLSATGVPALIETPLAGPGEPVACTPRDAVRAVYSSSVDALVMGRFVLMKDYWLLRSHVD